MPLRTAKKELEILLAINVFILWKETDEKKPIHV